MTVRALILPYVQRPGLAGCEITIQSDAEWTRGIPSIEQREIGRIVDLEEPRPVQRRHRREQWQTKERVITEDDVRAAVAWAQGILLRYGVTDWEIQTATGDSVTAQRSQWIGAAMRSALYIAELDAPQPTVDPPRRATSEDIQEASHGRQNGCGVDDSDWDGDGSGCPGGAREGGAESSERSAAEEPESSGIRPRDAVVLGGDASDSATPAPAAIAADKQGIRILGVDPGSHWVACTVAELRGNELVYITSRVFEIGRVVPIKPRTIKRKDGSTYTIATKREILDADIGALLRAVMAWLEPLGVDRAVLERATHFRTMAPVDGAGGARATGLARAQWIGGELAGTLRVALYDAEGARDNVQTVASTSWRAVARRGIHSATTEGATVPYLWREGVITAFGSSWPGGIGEHAIDAAGCIVWAVCGPAARAAEPKAPRVRVERVKRTSAETHAKRDARTRRRRKRLKKKGCQCHGRHRRECPMFVPMKYRKGATA